MNGILRAARTVVVAALGILVGLPVVLYFVQDRLIFHPRPFAPGQGVPAGPGVEVIDLAVGGGEHVRGWLVDADAEVPAPLILYFGGNADELSWYVDQVRTLSGWRIALVNYRGYGHSTGRPGEAAIFADALALYDRLSERKDIDPLRIVALGRSLGSGVAVYLASQRRLAGVVLVSPFDSVRAIARSQYPFVPVNVILKHPFDSLQRAPGIATPALILVADEDTVIEPVRSQRLARAWRGPVELVRVSGASHNSIGDAPDYWPTIRRFLGSLDGANSSPPGRP